MIAASDDPETELLLNASLDGELDAASALAFERRLAAEPALAAARDKLVALRALLRESLPRDEAPSRLRAAMAAQAGAGTAPGWRRSAPGSGSLFTRRPMARDWRMATAACLLGAALGAGATTVLTTARGPTSETADVVADHLRAVMAPQPFDVASSDQHTVKPWFTGRLSFAPQVFDLVEAGFPLAGGRVDVVGGEPAATLVFRHDKHLISLMAQPSVRSAPAPAGPTAGDRGFTVREWLTGGMRYWAVSDVAPAELDSFERLFRARLDGSG